MTGWLVASGVLLVWLVWDEIRNERAYHFDPPVTVVGEQDPWDDYVVTLPPGSVIVAADGLEFEVSEAWPADVIVKTLAEVEAL